MSLRTCLELGREGGTVVIDELNFVVVALDVLDCFLALVGELEVAGGEVYGYAGELFQGQWFGRLSLPRHMTNIPCKRPPR